MNVRCVVMMIQDLITGCILVMVVVQGMESGYNLDNNAACQAMLAATCCHATFCQDF